MTYNLAPGQYLARGSQTFRTSGNGLGTTQALVGVPTPVPFPSGVCEFEVTGLRADGTPYLQRLVYQNFSSFNSFCDLLKADLLALLPGWSVARDTRPPITTNWELTFNTDNVSSQARIFNVAFLSGLSPLAVPGFPGIISSIFQKNEYVSARCCPLKGRLGDPLILDNSYLSKVPESASTSGNKVIADVNPTPMIVPGQNNSYGGVIVDLDLCACCMTVLTGGIVGINLQQSPAFAAAGTVGANWLLYAPELTSAAPGFRLSQIGGAITGYELIGSVAVLSTLTPYTLHATVAL